MKNSDLIKKLLFILVMVFGLNIPSFAVDIAGIKLPDTTQIGQQDLRLNGVGVRYKTVFKVYAAALYLSEKKTAVVDVLASGGAKRVSLVMLRDVSSNELSNGFLKGIRQNIDKDERAKLIGSMFKLGEIFALVPELTKGSVLNIDLIPKIGLSVSVNGKKLTEPIQDMALCNAVLKIWLGENPIDAQLKQAMLGESVNEKPQSF